MASESRMMFKAHLSPPSSRTLAINPSLSHEERQRIQPALTHRGAPSRLTKDGSWLSAGHFLFWRFVSRHAGSSLDHSCVDLQQPASGRPGGFFRDSMRCRGCPQQRMDEAHLRCPMEPRGACVTKSSDPQILHLYASVLPMGHTSSRSQPARLVCPQPSG